MLFFCSGQVRILSSGGLYEDEDGGYYDDVDDDEECIRPDKPPPTDPNPDTSNLKVCMVTAKLQNSQE